MTRRVDGCYVGGRREFLRALDGLSEIRSGVLIRRLLAPLSLITVLTGTAIQPMEPRTSLKAAAFLAFHQ
jgi:hypothetical protein